MSLQCPSGSRDAEQVITENRSAPPAVGRVAILVVMSRHYLLGIGVESGVSLHIGLFAGLKPCAMGLVRAIQGR